MSLKFFFNFGEKNFVNFCFHLVCELGSNGFSIFIDGTLSGFNDIRDTLKLHRIPYFNFDYSIQSLVKMMEVYLTALNAVDAVFILQDEIAADEALHALMSKSPLRVILLDQLESNVVERLKNLRPTPSFYSIIADTVHMKRLFQKVSLNPYGTRSGP